MPGLSTAEERPNAPEGATRIDYNSWDNQLEPGETISSAVVAEEGSSDLGSITATPTASEHTINNVLVAAGRAVKFTVSGMLPAGSEREDESIATGVYRLKITVTTSASQVIPGWVEFTCQNK